MKPWRLTGHAERSLVEIAAWTPGNFGERQARAYRDALIERINAIAAEFPVVVTGVLVTLALGAWWQDRHNLQRQAA